MGQHLVPYSLHVYLVMRFQYGLIEICESVFLKAYESQEELMGHTTDFFGSNYSLDSNDR